MSGYNKGYGQGGQSGQQGYGQYNPYGQQNPYDQRDDGFSQPSQGYSGQAQGYGQQNQYNTRPELEHQSSSRYDEERAQGGYEMSGVNSRANDPNRILNEIRSVDRAVDEIETDLQRLSGLHVAYMKEPDLSRSPLRKEIERLGTSVMDKYRSLVQRMKKIKQDPESGNPRNAPNVGKVDRRIKAAINHYQQVDRDFRKECQAQMERQYRIVRPDASEQEVREAVQDTNNDQIFSQALISSNRRGEATRVAQNVRDRHADIQRIERDMMELAQLFNDLEAMVVQQEVAVTQIEQKGEEVTDNVVKANTELTGAVDKAKAARRKKWICLGIAVLIVIIIVIVVVVVVEVTKNH